MKKKYFVFMSHNKKDKRIAREMGLFLTAEDIPVWFDEWIINPGDSIAKSISEGLTKTTHFILLWSKNARASKWVEREMFSVLPSLIEKKSLKVIPVLLDNTPLPKIIRDLKYLKYNAGSEKDRNSLIKSITGKAATQNYIRAVVKKYHEMISGGDRGLSACPECGNTNLEWDKDEYPHCNECGWS